MDPYFIFKGIDSRDMGILISVMPEIVIPQKRIKQIMVPGRNGILHEEDGSFENYTLSMECGRRGIENIDSICSWLTGSGELILYTEPDKVYRATINNKITISDVIYVFNSFLIQFDCYPLKYSVNQSEEELVITAPSKIYNSGTYFSEPIITVYGTGNINLNINKKNFFLSNVNGYITIHSEMMEVYKDKYNCNNQFSAEDFPRFEVGQNEISFTGKVQKIEIFMNRRWI